MPFSNKQLATDVRLLRELTYVVVDLETTGMPNTQAGITEIGAVAVRNDEVLKEFRTFVNPGVLIPQYITDMTGIYNKDVVNAPSELEAVLQFLTFADFDRAGVDKPVLVAHNSNFDVNFLRQVCERHDHPWPKPIIVDTLYLARKVFGPLKAAAPAHAPHKPHNYKLDTLAEHFNTPVTPTHRALDDAQATVTVLMHLINHLAEMGVHDLAGLSISIPER